MNPRILTMAGRTALAATAIALALTGGPAIAHAAGRAGPIASAEVVAPTWTPVSGTIDALVRIRLSAPVNRMTVRLRVYDDKGIAWQRTRSMRSLRAFTYAIPFSRSVADIGLGPGVYPVRVQVSVSGSTDPVETTTTLIVTDPSIRPVPVSIVVRIAGTPMRDPAGRFVVDPASDTRPRLEAEALAHLSLVRPDLGVTAAIAPILLDEWRDVADGYSFAGVDGVVDVSAESTAAAECRRSLATFAQARTQGMPQLMGMYAEPDLAGLLRMDVVGVDVAGQLRLGSRVTSATLGSAQTTASVDSTGLAVLDGFVPASAARAAASAGVSFIVVDPASIERPTPGLAASAAYAVTLASEPGTAAPRMTALVTDPTGSRMLADPAGEPALAAYLLERALAKTLTGRPIVLEVSAGSKGARVSDIQPTLAALARLPWIRFTTASAAAATPTVRATLVDTIPKSDDPPADYWTEVRRARALAVALQAGAGPADPEAQAAIRSIYTAESRCWAGPDLRWPLADRGRSFAAAAERTASDTLSKIAVEVPVVTLAGSAGRVPVSVQNSSGKTLTVRVIASSTDMRLPPREMTTRLKPGENILSVPVDLGPALAGSLTIAVTLADLTLVTRTAQVHASYLDRFVLVGGVVVVLVVLLGYIRRRERRSVGRDAAVR